MKNRKTIIALLLVAIVGIVGLTIAYFANSQTIENNFITKEYGTEVVEEFVSPENWLPGDTTTKTVVAQNTGQVDQAVRVRLTEEWKTYKNGTLNGWIHPDGTKSTHTTETELSTDERVAVINFANNSDWTKVGDYYYYNYKLAPNEETSTLIESVTFNPKTKLDDTCETTIGEGTRTITCNSSGDDYDHATYKLTINIETVQYNKFNEAWNLNNSVTIAAEKPQPPVPGSQYLATNATNEAGAEYNATTKGNMFTFTHGTGANAVTETRYIGDEPNNYVKFNCDDNGENCETWRIIGIFDVERTDPNDANNTITEQRMKLVRRTDFATTMAWDSNNVNDWTNASFKTFLNGDYYNRTGTAATYGLKESARELIDDAIFYLGGFEYNTSTSTEQIYEYERGTATYNNSRPTSWEGKVALMYPSDMYMTYGNGVNNGCYNTPMNPSNCGTTNSNTSWIYKTNVLEGNTSYRWTWLLSPDSRNANHMFGAGSDNLLNDLAYNTGGGRPVVYLKSNIKIAEGTGEIGSEYTLETIQ